MKRVFLLVFLVLVLSSGLFAQEQSRDGLKQVELRQPGQNPWQAVTAWCHYTWLSDAWIIDHKGMGLGKIKNIPTAQLHNLEKGSRVLLPSNCSEPAPPEIAQATANILGESQMYVTGVRRLDHVTEAVYDANPVKTSELEKSKVVEQKEDIHLSKREAELLAEIQNLKRRIKEIEEAPGPFGIVVQWAQSQPESFQNIEFIVLGGLAVWLTVKGHYRRKREYWKEERDQANKLRYASEETNTKLQREVGELQTKLADSLPKQVSTEFNGVMYSFSLEKISYKSEFCGHQDIYLGEAQAPMKPFNQHLKRCTAVKARLKGETEFEKVNSLPNPNGDGELVV